MVKDSLSPKQKKILLFVLGMFVLHCFLNRDSIEGFSWREWWTPPEGYSWREWWTRWWREEAPPADGRFFPAFNERRRRVEWKNNLDQRFYGEINPDTGESINFWHRWLIRLYRAEQAEEEKKPKPVLVS